MLRWMEMGWTNSGCLLLPLLEKIEGRKESIRDCCRFPLGVFLVLHVRISDQSKNDWSFLLEGSTSKCQRKRKLHHAL